MEIDLWKPSDAKWQKLDKLVVKQLSNSKLIDWEWLELLLVGQK